MNKELLEEIGLTKSEINVYLALLELGSSTTGKIVEKSKASSSKIYEILDKLMEKGLVSYIIESGVKHFEAAPPERIMDYIEEKEEKVSKQKQELKKLIPELELKRTLSKYKTEATIFKGVKGGETAFRYLINSMTKKDEWIGFIVSFTNRRYFNLLTKLHGWRAKKGLKARILFNEKNKEDGKVREKLPYTKVKYVPDELQTPAIVNVAGNITLINIMSEEVTVFMIENKEVADSFRNQFEKLWEQNVFTYNGQEAVESAYNSILGAVKKDDEVVVFAAKPKTKEGADFNLEWTEKIRPKVKDYRLLYYGETEKNKKRAQDFEKRNCQTKIIPTEQTLPISTVVAGDVVLNSVWGKSPLAFNIKNKTVADSFRHNFNLLWDQEVKVYRGVKAIKELWNYMLEGSDELLAYGGAEKSLTLLGDSFWDNFHKRRITNKTKFRAVFHQSLKERATQLNKLQLTEVRTTSKNFEELAETVISGNKVAIIIYSDAPYGFLIEEKIAVKSYSKFFELIWKESKTK